MEEKYKNYLGMPYEEFLMQHICILVMMVEIIFMPLVKRMMIKRVD